MSILVENLTQNNLRSLVAMALKLWPDCNEHEELINYQEIMESQNATCFLIKKENQYIAFIHLALRTDYVEGTTTSPVGYIEGIFVDDNYRNQGFGNRLVNLGEEWSKDKGCTEYASDVELDNENSITFHEKSGFVRVNQIACFAKKIS